SFCHELGHAVLGRWAGYAVGSFGMGLGQPFLVWSWGTTRVYLGRSRPMQGITFSVTARGPVPRWGRVLMLSGGVGANPLLAAAAAGLLVLLPGWGPVWWALLFCNAVALINLVPITVRAGQLRMRSDGSQILQQFRRVRRNVPMPERIEGAQARRGLWQDVGD